MLEFSLHTLGRRNQAEGMRRRTFLKLAGQAGAAMSFVPGIVESVAGAGNRSTVPPIVWKWKYGQDCEFLERVCSVGSADGTLFDFVSFTGLGKG